MGPHNVEAVNVLRIEMDPQVSSTSCQAHAKVKIWIIRMCSKMLWKEFSPVILKLICLDCTAARKASTMLDSIASGLQVLAVESILTSIATSGPSLREAQ
jgi:hypothetical protein